MAVVSTTPRPSVVSVRAETATCDTPEVSKDSSQAVPMRLAAAVLAGLAVPSICGPHPRARALLVHGVATGTQRRGRAAPTEDALAHVQFCRLCPNPGAEGSEVSGLVAAQARRPRANLALARARERDARGALSRRAGPAQFQGAGRVGVRGAKRRAANAAPQRRRPRGQRRAVRARGRRADGRKGPARTGRGAPRRSRPRARWKGARRAPGADRASAAFRRSARSPSS